MRIGTVIALTFLYAYMKANVVRKKVTARGMRDVPV